MSIIAAPPNDIVLDYDVVINSSINSRSKAVTIPVRLRFPEQDAPHHSEQRAIDAAAKRALALATRGMPKPPVPPTVEVQPVHAALVRKGAKSTWSR